MEVDAWRKGVVTGSLLMAVITLVLFFVPAANGLVAGLIGGYRIGTARRALAAALVPAVVVALGLWVLLTLFEVPLIGALTATAALIWILLSVLGLLVGAVIGGLSREMSQRARTTSASGTA